MKVISTTKALLINDREGLLEEYVQIDITLVNKDDVLKEYTFRTVDSIVLNNGKENESIQSLINRHGQPQIKEYKKSYAEYDEQKEMLSNYFPSDLKGSELDDYLLQCGLLYNLENDPIYGVKFIAR